MTETAASPCVKLCVMDAARGHCLGCGRTLAEIGRWQAMGEDERRAVNARARQRVADQRKGHAH